MRAWLGVLVFPLVVACSSSGDDGGGKDAGPSCDPHAVSGAPTFTDRTADWGLAEITGNRLRAADLDGDGFPDLIVEAIGSNLRGSAAGELRSHVLMNRPGKAGGRSFVDETVASGFGQTRDGAPDAIRSSQVAVVADVDNDGDLDVFSGTYYDPSKADPSSPADADRSELLINDGAGRFTFGPRLPTIGELGTPLSGATFADVDRDGNIDLFVVGWYERYGFSEIGTQARLELGNGDGTFRESIADAGLLTETNGFDEGLNSRPAYAAGSCDVDGDGDADLLISAYGRQWNQLYLNDGAGHFTDRGRETGYAGDDDADYSDNQFFLCWCTLHGAEDPRCPAEVRPSVQCPTPADSYWGANDVKPWRNNGNTFTTVCADVTGDGVMDLYDAQIHHWWAGGSSDSSELLVGTAAAGAFAFTRPGNAATGLAWPHRTADWNEGGIHAAAVDLDNDGRLDVVVGASDYAEQYSLVFHQKPDGTFEEVGAAWGLHHPCASGLAIADFDRDGDLDVVVGSGTARDCGKSWSKNEVHLYENDASTRGHFLEVRLTGKAPVNAAAIGARVTVTAGSVEQVREVGGGYGHMGMQNDTVLHYGLGGCEAADSIEIRWPDRALTTTREPRAEAGRVLEVSGP
ncbi:MAG: CRTAC1 family protein [Sorangiineae bacterium]|nr:CRTAC1 family protein [Polyangiaceae bacterium]MEB2323104.1 CRTAC1 family protein [Sorangiineae bacterium]